MKIMENWVDSETGKITQTHYLSDKVSILNYEMYVAEDSIIRFPNAELKIYLESYIFFLVSFILIGLIRIYASRFYSTNLSLNFGL